MLITALIKTKQVQCTPQEAWQIAAAFLGSVLAGAMAAHVQFFLRSHAELEVGELDRIRAAKFSPLTNREKIILLRSLQTSK